MPVVPRLGSGVRIPSPAPNLLIELNRLRSGPRKRSSSFLPEVNTWSTPELCGIRPRKLKRASLGGKLLLLSRTDDGLTRPSVGQILLRPESGTIPNLAESVA